MDCFPSSNAKKIKFYGGWFSWKKTLNIRACNCKCDKILVLIHKYKEKRPILAKDDTIRVFYKNLKPNGLQKIFGLSKMIHGLWAKPNKIFEAQRPLQKIRFGPKSPLVPKIPF